MNLTNEDIIQIYKDQDSFAMAFAEWAGINDWLYYESEKTWIKDIQTFNNKSTVELLDLYKQSLTKTDKK